MQNRKLTKLSIDGDFPIVLHVDEDCLPISEKELTDLLEENNPFTFTGQRTPIYELPGVLGLHLRAKGFDYRATVYSEVKKYVLDEHEMLTIAKARELGLAMSDFSRPFAKRFKESSAHFEQSISQPDGSFRKEWTSPRPYAAMTLERAMNEYEQTRWARENGLNVDLPLGYAEFPELNFKANGKKVRCGGFLGIIPTPFDLRFPEIIYHIPHSEEIRKLYEVYDKETDPILLYFLKSAAHSVSLWHENRRTLTYIHPMNVKWGLVGDDMKVKMRDERGNPIVTLCDLDAVQHESNASDNVFLANTAEDLHRLSAILHSTFMNTTETPESIANKMPEDDQKSLFDLMLRMRDQSHLRPPTPITRFYIMAGYFGLDPANIIVPLLSSFVFAQNREKGINICEQDDYLLRMLKKRHDL